MNVPGPPTTRGSRPHKKAMLRGSNFTPTIIAQGQRAIDLTAGSVGFRCELRKSGEPRVREILAFRLCDAVLGWRDHGIGTGSFVGLCCFCGAENGGNSRHIPLDNNVRMFVQ